MTTLRIGIRKFENFSQRQQSQTFCPAPNCHEKRGGIPIAPQPKKTPGARTPDGVIISNINEEPWLQSRIPKHSWLRSAASRHRDSRRIDQAKLSWRRHSSNISDVEGRLWIAAAAATNGPARDSHEPSDDPTGTAQCMKSNITFACSDQIVLHERKFNRNVSPR